MAIRVASWSGSRGLLVTAAFVAAAVAAGAAARGAATSPPAAPSEWDRLTIQPIAAGSVTGAWAEPGPAVERLASREESDAAAPRRLTGEAGTNLNQALAAAGVPGAVAQDYLRALAGRIRLADGISIKDRFDLVVVGEGDRPMLLYAGLDRLGASDVQLMRWAHDGRTEWVDATGTAAQAEAMRMPVAGSITSSFGMRYHPLLHYRRFHRGVDLKAAWGTPIRASADGIVSFAGWAGGYGRQVRIGHGEGLATSYSHMSRIAAAPGARVHRGDVIGFVGSSGLSTGPHVHYEVFKNGKPVNPATVRYVGGGENLGKQERRDFNARLRALLTFKSRQA